MGLKQARFRKSIMTKRAAIQRTMRSGDLVRRAKALLEDSFTDRFLLNSFADSLETGPRRLRTAFKKTLGCSPSEFVTKLRIEKASKLLRAGTPIKQVAVEAGFVDQAHLTRRFKRLTGMTPGQYQAEHFAN